MPTAVAPDPLVTPTERLAEPPALVTPGEFSGPGGGSAGVRDPQDVAGASNPVEQFRQPHPNSPSLDGPLPNGARLPAAGEEFAGFRLVRELGRGAFGRVYLAEQIDLSDRQVVLKVTLDARTEARALARLLHTHIVPVYSIHRSGLYQAVCMPFCGSVTLADAIRRFRGDTLPESGKGLVTFLQSSSAPGGRLTDGPPATIPAVEAPPAHQPSSTVVLDLLGGLSYVDAVLWLGARLADGLAHAHDRGVLHRDLKPANVLLTDDGVPMLLDFNLSADAVPPGTADAARLGGTLPYMPPEHLEAYAGRARVVDARSDVYSLGVILFELLTGQHPFPVYGRAGPEQLQRMVADREAIPRLRDRNPAVSPAVDSLVRKCLDPDPDRRYPSAHALQEDLERQLRHEPLRHAPDRDPRERFGKWARRHPRLASGFTLGTGAALLVGLAVGLALYQRDRRLGLEAREARTQFFDDVRRFQFAVTGTGAEDDRRSLDEAVAAGRQALARYPAPDDPAWDRAPAVRHLPADDRRRLREEMGVTLLMLAHATAKGVDATTALEEALRWNHQAAACFPPAAVPGPVLAQRAELLRRLNREADGRAGSATVRPPDGARELYLAGWDLARAGRYAAAVPVLRAATRKDPQAAWAWFLLARCHDGLGQDIDAVACYGTCVALSPDTHQGWYNRGLAHLRRGAFADAQADFDRVIDLRGDVADAFYNRALARRAQDDLAGAEADCSRALEVGDGRARYYFVRAELRDKLGRPADAAVDRREGLAREPVEESDWTTRGFHKLRGSPADPTGALADFDRALDRNPNYRPALINKAHVLAERLGRAADAAAVLETASNLYPDQAELRAARAVYLARTGRRADAHAEAEAALRIADDPATRYQVAGVYALTSKTNPADRAEAFRLLSAALARGYGFEHLDSDPELAPVRSLKEFRDLVSAARALRPSPKP